MDERIRLNVISIHAPTKGATAIQSSINSCLSISIHAPTKGATAEQIRLFRRRAISIHAPTKGATALNQGTYYGYFISIHAPTKGATRAMTLLFYVGLIFQSTLPRRERLCVARVQSCYHYNFNPRSHEGSDRR